MSYQISADDTAIDALEELRLNTLSNKPTNSQIYQAIQKVLLHDGHPEYTCNTKFMDDVVSMMRGQLAEWAKG